MSLGSELTKILWVSQNCIVGFASLHGHYLLPGSIIHKPEIKCIISANPASH